MEIIMKTNYEYNKLFGALIGLVRATEGNEELVNKSTDAIILEALRIDPESTESAELAALLYRITEEKRRLIPNCFCCEARCGRTDDYDMQELYNAPDDIRETKLMIISNLLKIAKCADYKSSITSETWETVYNAIFYLGLDLGKNDLLSMVADTENTILRLCEA